VLRWERSIFGKRDPRLGYRPADTYRYHRSQKKNFLGGRGPPRSDDRLPKQHEGGEGGDSSTT